MTSPINLGFGGLGVMADYRFRQIKSVYPWAFEDRRAIDDPWKMILLGVNGYNKSRRDWIAASVMKILDESMSAWCPQSTKTGGLPHLSFILRKPEPLGTEFKCICCSVTGIILVLEIQRGKLPMQQQEFSKEFGGTAGCTFRLVDETLHNGASNWVDRKIAKDTNKKELYGGDSWFSSVIVAEGLSERGHEYIGALKTNHALFPKEEIEALMKEWPSGSDLVFECTSPKGGHKLLAIGYKYNARKTLCFVATRNAGSTQPGPPYVAKFNDAVGNVCERKVPRPTVISKYFSKCNGIDAHNQGRQGILALEKRWITQDPWFRVATTLFGMTVTDCWKSYKHALPERHPMKQIRLVEFADRMAFDLINNCNSAERGDGGSLMLPMTVSVDTEDTLSSSGALSPLTQASVVSLDEVRVAHRFVDNEDLEAPDKNGRQRPMRRTCHKLGCKRKYHKMCCHHKCRLRSYNVNGSIKYGYFYCEEHQLDHWMDVINGRA